MIRFYVHKCIGLGIIFALQIAQIHAMDSIMRHPSMVSHYVIIKSITNNTNHNLILKHNNTVITLLSQGSTQKDIMINIDSPRTRKAYSINNTRIPMTKTNITRLIDGSTQKEIGELVFSTTEFSRANNPAQINSVLLACVDVYKHAKEGSASIEMGLVECANKIVPLTMPTEQHTYYATVVLAGEELNNSSITLE